MLRLLRLRLQGPTSGLWPSVNTMTNIYGFTNLHLYKYTKLPRNVALVHRGWIGRVGPGCKCVFVVFSSLDPAIGEAFGGLHPSNRPTGCEKRV